MPAEDPSVSSATNEREAAARSKGVSVGMWREAVDEPSLSFKITSTYGLIGLVDNDFSALARPQFQAAHWLLICIHIATAQSCTSRRARRTGRSVSLDDSVTHKCHQAEKMSGEMQILPRKYWILCVHFVFHLHRFRASHSSWAPFHQGMTLT